jgi:hypothetical protein
MTPDEKATALALHRALRPKLDPVAFRAASEASIAQHGVARHDVLKVAAMHASRKQLTDWKAGA